MNKTICVLLMLCLTFCSCVSKSKYNSLESEYESLQSKYKSLQSKYESLQDELAEKEDQISRMENIIGRAKAFCVAFDDDAYMAYGVLCEY